MQLPDFAASEATRRFRAELYIEHLDEASFLYEQKLGLYDDPEVTWLGIGDVENRLEAHLKALVSGEESALEICQSKTEEGEPGDLYVAVCVFCRGGRRELLGGILKRLDPENAARSRAVRDAITDEMPADWADALAPSLARGFDKLIPIVAHFLGRRRLAADAALDKLIIDRVPTVGLAEVMWGLGRVGGDTSASQVASYARHEDAAVRRNAVMALLRRGDDRALAQCRQGVTNGDHAMCLPLAVSGRRSDAAVLRGDPLTKEITPELLIAWGVLGELSAVRFLLDRLTDDKLAAAAATALQLITGADLREEAFIPEVVEEDELFEDERQAFQQTGEGPKHVDDRPFGVSVKRISQNPDDWRAWLETHKSEFDATQRYRLGKPFSPATLVDTLVSPFYGRLVRSLAYEELVIRYGIDEAFETDMRTKEQKKQINAIARLCRSNEASFQPGAWYFARTQI